MAPDVQPLVSSPVKRPFSSNVDPAGSQGTCTDENSVTGHHDTPSAPKRRKLTAQEKDDLQALRQLRIREKEENKTRREREKQEREDERRIREATREEERRAREAAREEERRARDVAREEERRAKEEQRKKKADELDEKRRQKDELKRLEEHERQKKERSQLRLNAFFSIPKLAALADRDSSSDPGRASRADSQASCTAGASQPVAKTDGETDYDRVFLPFCVPTHTRLAAYNRQLGAVDDLVASRTRLDQIMRFSPPDFRPRDGLAEYFTSRPSRRIRLEPAVSAVVGHDDAGAMLERITMRHLYFDEDVRPPYYGTMTRVQDRAMAATLFRNPFKRLIPNTDYDYDSEAEWVAEDGEDVDEDEEDVESESEAEDLDGFLDDDDADVGVEKPAVPLVGVNGQPTSTGICWEDPTGAMVSPESADGLDMAGLEIGLLTWQETSVIDPFCTDYWNTPATTTTTSTTTAATTTTAAGTAPTTASPLTLDPSRSGDDGSVLGTTDINGGGTAGKNGKRHVPPDLLDDFKREIVGSDMTKIALVEALKKRFPKVPKEALANTLALVAERVGPKASDKRWALKS